MSAAALALLLALQASPASVPPGAPLEVDEFRYSRKVLQAPPGLVTLTLDAEVLAHSSLGDLRLADAHGRQIPYLREDSPDPLVLDLPAPERVEGEARRHTRYRLKMPYATLPASRLLLDTPAAVFERSVRLAGPRSRRGPPRWSSGGVVWRDADPARPARPLTLDVPAHPGPTLDLVLDEGDNAPLPLGRVRLHVPTSRLRFFHPGGSGVRLLYGREGLGAPRYDLSLIAAQLDPAQAREVKLGPEPIAGSDPARAPRGLFWSALVTAVLVLLLVLARLLQGG